MLADSTYIALGVNIDHIATLRQARGTRYPDPVQAAFAAEQAGADAITMHLREDRRHIQEHDVEIVQQRKLSRLNLEMAATPDMLAFAEKLQPEDCCLVPERRAELTTEGGLDVVGQLDKIKDACARLASAKVRVSLFIDADPAQIEAALECAAPVIEIHTGHYADCSDSTTRDSELQRIAKAAELATVAGLQVNAGHGLNYQNVRPIAALPQVRELNIGHAIVAQAVFSGLQAAVQEMKRVMQAARMT